MSQYLLLLLLFTISFAQISDYSYLGSEATAKSGAVVSDQGNNWSIFHNPAALTEINNINFSAGNTKLYNYDFLSNYHFSIYLPLPLLGKVGIGVQQLETNYNKTKLSTEQTISFAKGIILQKDNNSNLSIGYTTNFITWDMGKSAGLSGDGTDGYNLGSINTITVDFGILGSLREKYRFGVLVKNITSAAIGTGLSRQILTQRINTGITYNPISMLSTTIVSEHILGYDYLQIKAGLSYELNQNIKIFTGAQSNPNRFGFGIKLISLNLQSISYSILSHPILPITHQIDIGISL